ncbi:MAG: BREX-2 system phosphatase PglZ [Pseudomonadota bacterium]|nr:BREX-2 system phosphatase PglZ [Pseudomonadota bacterium]
MTPTPEQVAAQVAALLRRRPEARVLGIHAPGGWGGGDHLAVNGERLPVAFCRSRLEISQRLAALDDAGRLVLLTPLSQQELGLDILVRLDRRRLAGMDPWEMVRQAFRASHIDPRLPMQDWLAQALLAAADGTAAAPGGWLDADRAWRAVLDHRLGLDNGRPDAADLIQWSLDAGQVGRYAALDGPLRDGIRARLAETAGALGEVLVAALDAGQGANLLAIGLACQVLFGNGRRSATLAQGIARLEPRLGGRTLAAAQGRAWHQAAMSVWQRLPAHRRPGAMPRAEGLLAELKVEAFAGLSTVLDSGLEQRLAAFARALTDWLDGKAGGGAVEAALGNVADHGGCAGHRPRLRRLEMAARLVRRLESPEPPPAGLAAAVTRHLTDGAFVDWARRYLLGGDPLPLLAQAFGRLHQRLRGLREPQNRAFAESLRDWQRNPLPGVPAGEEFLDKVVATVAAKAPVLVVVMDGMDGGVFEELGEDLRQRGWVRWAEPGGSAGLLSVLPTVTGYARTALLTGRLAAGTSATEKAGFAGHAALRALSRPGRPPLLFHKGDLTEAAAQGLAAAVRDAINSPDQRVVGVVLNAVDDHLAKAGQLRIQWTVDAFRVLDALLYEARVAGRAVVMTADHGHVLEADSRRLAGGTEARWRTYSEPLADEEMAFAGPRIKAATGEERLVLMWSEACRYGQKQNGYHGGAALQEAVVPVGVFLSVGQKLAGWQPLAEHVPEWWTGRHAT